MVCGQINEGKSLRPFPLGRLCRLGGFPCFLLPPKKAPPTLTNPAPNTLALLCGFDTRNSRPLCYSLPNNSLFHSHPLRRSSFWHGRTTRARSCSIGKRRLTTPPPTPANCPALTHAALSLSRLVALSRPSCAPSFSLALPDHGAPCPACPPPHAPRKPCVGNLRRLLG